MTPSDLVAAKLTHRTTHRSGVRIQYLDNAPETVGSAARLPILFSPGLTDHADEYSDMLAFFAQRRVLVVEVRGRGGSEAPRSGYSAAAHVADLRAVLDEESIGRFHLMTFSRGTTWGLDLMLEDPSRVETVSIGDYWAREKQLDPTLAEQMLSTRFRRRPMRDRLEPHVIAEVLAASVDRDLFDGVAAAGRPVLVATGTEPGCLLDDETLDEWRRRVPGTEIAVIDGAAHDLFRPDRLAFPKIVHDFIVRRAPGT